METVQSTRDAVLFRRSCDHARFDRLDKRPRLSWARWLLLAAVLGLALLQVRHQAMFAILAATILPQGFARSGQHQASETSPAWLVGALAILLIGVRAAMPLVPAESETNPWKLIAAVPPKLRSQPVLNGYSMGGPLILSGIRPYIDGRGDMYGDELVLGFSRIGQGDAAEFNRAVEKWNIRWAIVPSNSKRLVDLLDRAGWRRIASDEAGVVYARSD